MKTSVKSSLGRENERLAEEMIARLAKRMARQSLCDFFLLILPPIGALFYLLFFVLSFAHRDAVALVLAAAAVGCAGHLMRSGGRRAAASRVCLAAGLLDEQSGGKERFLTLATLGAVGIPSLLAARLRQEAARLAGRVDLRKDFPYRIKRSFPASLAISVVAVVALNLVRPTGFGRASDPLAVDQAARELSETFRLAARIPALQMLAERLQDARLSAVEKREWVQGALRDIENELSRTPQRGNRGDELGEAVEALRGLERKLGKPQGEGGGLETHLQEGEGKGKETGSGGDGKVDKKRPAQDGENSEGEKVESPGTEPETKSDAGGQGGKAAEESLSAQQDWKRQSAKQGEGTGGGANVKDEFPTGPKPERYLGPGERAEKGLKNGRFVTVQLPEEEAATGATPGDSGKKREVRPRIPTQNTPLSRAALPDALPERQHVPLEYRGAIR